MRRNTGRPRNRPSKGTLADHDEIRATLRAYEQAYTSGDVDAIERLYPQGR